MRSDLTDITVVLDRSGSMAGRRKDAEGGLNAFVDEQKKQPGSATFTLVQFDTTYEFVHKAIPIADVPACKLEPRGGTALLDAVGRAIIETGDRLKAMPENDRPGLVAFVILTDGEENSSHEFSLEKIKEMIQHQQDTYKWQFTFLGANQDAFASAGGMGITLTGAMDYAEEKTSGAIQASSSALCRLRSATASGAKDVTWSYTDAERASVSGN